MAILNVTLNLLSNNSFVKAAGDIKVVNSSLGATNDILDSISKKEDRLKKMQFFSGLSTISTNVFSSLKTISDGVGRTIEKFNEYASQGDRIAKTSRLVGLSVKDYQAFSQAAQHAGMSTEEMDGALKRFNVNLGKARGGDSKAFKIFDSILGGKKISEFKDSSSLLAAVADGYEKLGSAEQKAFVSQELFGKTGLKMTELLQDGGEKLKNRLDYAIPGFSDQGAKDAEAFKDALQDMNGEIGYLKISVMEGLFPVFTDLFGTIKSFVKENGTEIKGHLLTIFGSVGTFVKSLLPKIPPILESIIGIVDKIGPWIPAITAGVFALLPALSQMVIGVMAIKPIIGGIVAIISGPLLGGVALVVGAVVSWGIAIKSIYDNWDMLKSFIVDDVGGAIIDFGNKFIAVANWIWDGFKSIFIDPWINFFKVLPQMVSDLWNGFKKVIPEIGNLLYDTFVGSVKSAISGIKGVLKSVPFLDKIFGDDEASLLNGISSASAAPESSSSLGATVARSISESRTTTTSRFSVDFTNMPRGVQVTPPEQGDFDWSRGYVLGGL